MSHTPKSPRARALEGGVVVATGFALSQVIRLAGNVVVARLLFEEAFALMAIVTAVVVGLAMFSDVGINASVVRSERGDQPAFLDTAWTLAVIRGVLLAIVTLGIAIPISEFYASNDPLAGELKWLLAIVAISTALSGFYSPKLMTAARHVKLVRPTLVELCAQVTAVGTMVTVAYFTRSVYALAVSSVAGAICHLILSYLFLWGRLPRFRVHREHFSEIIHFGKWVFVTTALTFVALQIDKLAFPAFFPLSVVGIYAIAASLAVVVPTIIIKIQYSIAFPLYAESFNSGQDLTMQVREAKAFSLAIGAYLVVLMIGGGPAFVEWAYDDRYADAGIFLVVLAVAAWASILESSYAMLFLAMGRPKLNALTNGVKVVVFLVVLWGAIGIGSFWLAIGAVVIAEYAKALVALCVARRLGFRDTMIELRASAFVVAGGVILAGWHLTVPLAADISAPSLMIVNSALASAAFYPLLRKQWRLARGLNQAVPRA